MTLTPRKIRIVMQLMKRSDPEICEQFVEHLPYHAAIGLGASKTDLALLGIRVPDLLPLHR